MRAVRSTHGRKLMSRRALTRTGKQLGVRSVISGKPVITPYHEQTGQNQERIQPSINDRPFDDFWKPKPGSTNFTDTVDHRLMEVRKTGGETASVSSISSIEGVWHLKSPGNESPREKRKRRWQKAIYRLLNQNYKGRYYDDHKLLVQKEVLATNLYRALVLEGVSKKNSDDRFAGEFQCDYSFDEKNTRHYIAIKHLDGYKSADTLFNREGRPEAEGPGQRIFDERHNPATDLVIRRFFLGDEDYLKLDNYMIKQNKDRASRTRMLCIDFGMAFYNMFRLPRRCSLKQFRAKLLGKSKKHRVQYRSKPTMHTVLRLMNQGQVDQGIQAGLEKIARLDDVVLERLLWHIHDPAARNALFTILQHRRDQARAILRPGQSLWPEDLPSSVSDGLVRRGLRS